MTQRCHSLFGMVYTIKLVKIDHVYKEILPSMEIVHESRENNTISINCVASNRTKPG